MTSEADWAHQSNEQQERDAATSDPHTEWVRQAMSLALSYANAVSDMQCYDSRDHLKEMIHARELLLNHLRTPQFGEPCE